MGLPVALGATKIRHMFRNAITSTRDEPKPIEYRLNMRPNGISRNDSPPKEPRECNDTGVVERYGSRCKQL